MFQFITNKNLTIFGKSYQVRAVFLAAVFQRIHCIAESAKISFFRKPSLHYSKKVNLTTFKALVFLQKQKKCLLLCTLGLKGLRSLEIFGFNNLIFGTYFFVVAVALPTQFQKKVSFHPHLLVAVQKGKLFYQNLMDFFAKLESSITTSSVTRTGGLLFFFQF